MYPVSNRGFSILELVLALGVLVIVTLSSGYVLLLARDHREANSQSQELNRELLVSMQRARSIPFVSRVIGLTNAVGAVINPALEACFGGRSAGCAALAANGILFSENLPNSNNQATFQIVCTANACEKVVISANVTPDAVRGENAVALKGRTFQTEILGAFFVNRSNIDFGCSDPQMVTRINFSNLNSTCGTSVDARCSDLGPIIAIQGVAEPANCMSKVTSNCPNYGQNQLGLFAGQGTCAPQNLGAPGTF